jgi:site-specific recombinase XerD
MKTIGRLFQPKRRKMPDIKVVPIRYLGKEEVSRFFEAIPVACIRDRILFDLIYRHGLRRIEATWLKKEWITNGRIWIKRAKKGISQEYNLHPDSIALLSLYMKQRSKDTNPFLFTSRESGSKKSISVSLIYQLFRDYAEKANIPSEKRFVHILRHSVAVHLLNAGWDIIDVQDWLGHKDIKSTTIYGKISNKRREKQFHRLLESSELATTIVSLKNKTNIGGKDDRT